MICGRKEGGASSASARGPTPGDGQLVRAREVALGQGSGFLSERLLFQAVLQVHVSVGGGGTVRVLEPRGAGKS